MISNKRIIVALEANNPELKKVVIRVRKQVLRYESAKKAGTLKNTDHAASRLF
ncbi:MAG: hypothetical protein RL293_1414 [Bacteroidota bacterium]|jgi:hypothetical protein